MWHNIIEMLKQGGSESEMESYFSNKIYFNKFFNEPQKLNRSVGSSHETASLTPLIQKNLSTALCTVLR